ncbi:MAG: RNA polymerase sigma factor [Planctomycetota bacterium]|jgi:RNA polymerase sigma-70 factor (ECF subfamily)
MGQAARSDEDLATAALAGDEEAARALFDRHSTELRRMVRRRLPSLMRRKVAESDIIQDAYLAAYLGLNRFEERGEGSFRRWLATILDRRIKSELRRHLGTGKRNLGREVSVERSGEGLSPVATDPTPSARAMAGESHERLRDALRELPDDYRTVLRLIHDEHRSLAEVAEIIGRSSEAVRKLYGRAIGRLSDRMDLEA